MKKNKLYILTVFFAFMAMGLVGCSDDDAAQQNEMYGYAQFKLYKSESAEGLATATRAVEKLDRLSSARIIQVVLQSAGSTITQSLKLNSYNEENAEYGLRSEKMKLVAGNYKIIGYTLYNDREEELLSADVNNGTFDVVAGGLVTKDLSVNAVGRGKVSFKIVKEMAAMTRATESEDDASFPMGDIVTIDVTVQNLFTLEKTTFETLKAEFVFDFNNDATADKGNSETSYLECDTILSLPAGKYKVYSFRAYSDKKGTKLLGNGDIYNTGEKTFEVFDNVLSKNVEVPFDIKGTEEYIKDYIALKEIWEALNGPSWKYKGIVEPVGCNWYFNKDIDLWGDQPGVQLHGNGRVATISLEGFGAKGVVPSAIGQLTELEILYLGSHSEQLGGHIFPNMTEQQKMDLRMDYDRNYLEQDFRTFLSPEWQKTIELDNNEKPLLKKGMQLKAIQFGDKTNQITGISKAIMRCTNLHQFYIANSPITSENFFVDDIDAGHKYAEEESSWSWENFKYLTDMEIYNCTEMTSLPMDMLKNLPELQMLNIACMKGISGDKLRENWIEFINGKSGSKIQGIYMGYNNLVEFPEHNDLKKMVKLGLLDLTNNKIETLHPFGKEINIAKIYLDYNKIKEIPNIDGYFCGFAQMESFSASHNEIEVFPDIFNANLIDVCPSANFSYNKISSFENGDNFRGLNVGQVNLSNNKLEIFPGILFKKNSPMTYLVLSGNGMKEIPKGALKGENSHFLEALDLSYNKLTKLTEDFYATNLPYLTGIDLSYNSFDHFPTQVLDIPLLARLFLRYQSDDKGNRCMREWPVGIWQHLGLRFLLLGGNDLRKIEDTMPYSLFYFEIADNPNITINVSEICDYIYYGYMLLVYDKTQDIRGCETLKLEN